MKKFLTVILIIALIFTLFGCDSKLKKGSGATPVPSAEPKDNETLYTEAVEDAKEAEADELYPLITLSKDIPFVTWNEEGNKVLLLSWHNSPEFYAEGKSCTFLNHVWTFTDGEIISWYKGNKQNVTDWTLRLEQLTGSPEGSGYTHVSAFWVDLNEVIRPAYETSVGKQLSPESLDGKGLGIHKDWFENNTKISYEETLRPWTKLGYTYDWNQYSGEYGLTEFLILQGSEVEIEWTKTTEEFIKWMELGGNAK